MRKRTPVKKAASLPHVCAKVQRRVSIVILAAAAIVTIAMGVRQAFGLFAS